MRINSTHTRFVTNQRVFELTGSGQTYIQALQHSPKTPASQHTTTYTNDYSVHINMVGACAQSKHTRNTISATGPILMRIRIRKFAHAYICLYASPGKNNQQSGGVTFGHSCSCARQQCGNVSRSRVRFVDESSYLKCTAVIAVTWRI